MKDFTSEGLAKYVSSKEVLDAIFGLKSSKNSDEFFKRCVKLLSEIFKVKYVFIGIYNNKYQNTIKTLAVWAEDKWVDNFTYDLKNTPCQDILNRNIEIIPRQFEK